MSLDAPVVCPTLASREHELESLRQVAARVAEGFGQVVLVSGEAGIGKSRLVRELCGGLADQGWLIYQGSCFERDRVLPYAPLVDVLRTLLASLSPSEVERCVGPALPDLAQLLPALGPRSGSRDAAPEQVKRSVTLALGELLSQLAARQSLLLLLEDLHWADDTSLDVLAAVARRVPRERILLLGTYRDDEVGPGLGALLVELDRRRASLTLRLNRLPPQGVAAMVAAIRPIRTDVVELIYLLSDGNPFFVEELVRSLPPEPAYDRPMRMRASELRLPRSIQDAVLQRADQLSPQARKVLVLAAVAGRRFDFQLLQQLAGHTESELLSLMKELVAAQLVAEVVEVEGRGDQFAFRHALTREAIYRQLLGVERRRLHRQIADTLEQRVATSLDPRLEDLAYHYSEACVWDKAFVYAERAGIRADGLYAPTSAVEHYTRALEAAQRLGVAPPPHLLRARGLAHGHLGNFDLAHADHAAVLAAAELEGDRRSEWQALMDLGFLWAGRSYQQTRACFDRALDLARQLDDPLALAYSLNRVGNWHVNVEQPAAGERCHREALAIFQRLDNRHGLAVTLDLLGLARYMQADLIEAVACRDQAIGLFRELEDRVGLTTALAHRAASVTTYHSATAAAPAQFQREAIRIAEEAVRLAQASGLRDFEAFARMILASLLGRMGEYGRALTEAEIALHISDDIDHHQWACASHYTLAEIYRDLLDLERARTHFSQALRLASEVGSGNWTTVISGSQAAMLASSGDTTAATAVLQPFGVDADPPSETMGQRQVRLAAAELALSHTDADRALRLLSALCGSGDTPTAADVNLARARALRSLRRHVEAEAAARASLERAASCQLVSVTWRAHAELAGILASEGRADAADVARSKALEIIDDIANRLPGAYPAADFRTAAYRAMGLGARTRQRLARGPHALTTREREVAVLIAAGSTNRGIAEQLVVSERTVESHVSGILSKLGFNTRAQIAAWATAQGMSLADPRTRTA